jgi:hypothetical protein
MILINFVLSLVVCAGTNCTWFYVKKSQFLVYERSFVRVQVVQIVREISEFLLHVCAVLLVRLLSCRKGFGVLVWAKIAVLQLTRCDIT